MYVEKDRWKPAGANLIGAQAILIGAHVVNALWAFALILVS